MPGLSAAHSHDRCPEDRESQCDTIPGKGGQQMELPANWPLLSVPRSSAPGPQPTPFPTTLQLLLMAGPLPCTMPTLGSPSPLAPDGLRAVRVDKEGGRKPAPCGSSLETGRCTATPPGCQTCIPARRPSASGQARVTHSPCGALSPGNQTVQVRVQAAGSLPANCGPRSPSARRNGWQQAAALELP